MHVTCRDSCTMKTVTGGDIHHGVFITGYYRCYIAHSHVLAQQLLLALFHRFLQQHIEVGWCVCVWGGGDGVCVCVCVGGAFVAEW